MALPGRMTRFRISELSGVDVPAQRGAVAVFIKRDEDSGDGDDSLDGAIEKMIARGEAIVKSGREIPQRAAPGDAIDWSKTAAQHRVDFDEKAKARRREKPNLTYEQAYSEVLGEHPLAARRMILG
jgi:hypothetical protein